MTEFMKIDLSDFDKRKDEIAKDLMKAASEHGFFYGKKKRAYFLRRQKLNNISFQVVNHEIPVQSIRQMFDASQSFFELPENTKEDYHMDHPRNAGWEKITQVM